MPFAFLEYKNEFVSIINKKNVRDFDACSAAGIA